MPYRQRNRLLKYEKYKTKNETQKFFVDQETKDQIYSQTVFITIKDEIFEKTPENNIEGVGPVGKKEFLSTEKGKFLYLFLEKTVSCIAWTDLFLPTNRQFVCIGTTKKHGEDVSEKGGGAESIFVYQINGKKSKRMEIKHLFGGCRQIFCEMRDKHFLFFCLFTNGNVHVFVLPTKTGNICILKKTLILSTKSPIVCFSVTKGKDKTIGTCHKNGSVCLWQLKECLKTKQPNKSFFDSEECSTPTSCVWNDKDVFFVSRRNGKVDRYSHSSEPQNVINLKRNVLYKLDWDVFDDCLTFCEETTIGFLKENKLEKKRSLCDKNRIVTDFSSSSLYPLYAVGGIDGVTRVCCFRRNKKCSWFEIEAKKEENTFSVKLNKKEEKKTEKTLQIEPNNAITQTVWCDNKKRKGATLALGYENGLVFIVKKI